jgi:hypothetical protein
MSLARHAPAGRRVPRPALSPGRGTTPAQLWPGVGVRLFDSGTAALGCALRLAFAAAGTPPENPVVLLPAYACPNLAAAVLWAGATPRYYDLARDTLGPAPGALADLQSAPDALMVHVDAFGADTFPQQVALSEGARGRVVHDLAQSFAPYASDWRPRFPFSVLSTGRAKPASLTLGGVLLTGSDAGERDTAQSEDTPSVDVPAWKWAVRSAIYSLSLHPLVFGALARIPALGIGQTRFSPLTDAVRLPERWLRIFGAAAADVRDSFQLFTRQTAAMLQLAQDSGARLPVSALQNQDRAPLWRVPVLCPTPESAAALARDGGHLGISRLYRRPLPEIMGIAPAEVVMQWPEAAWLAERLVTLPTHGRLGGRLEDELRRLLERYLR